MRIAPLLVLAYCLSVSAASLKTVTVGDSKMYGTLALCEAAEQTNLTTSAGSPLKIECYPVSGGDTSQVIFDGWTTDANNFILVTNAGTAHGGKWNTSAYYLSCTVAPLDIREEYVNVDGLQLKLTRTATGASGIALNSAVSTSVVKISNCIIWAALTSVADGYGIYVDDADRTVYVWNCLIYDWINGAVSCRGILHSAGTVYLFNNTAQNCLISYRQLGGTMNITNCLSQSDGSDDFASAGGTFKAGYLCSDRASVPGANSISSHTVTFVDAANDDFHISATEAGASPTVVGSGLTDPGAGLFSDDIDRVTRSGNWTIGADQYVSTATKPTTTYLLKGLLR